MAKFCQLQLTCADSQEAEKIASDLLNKRLVACVRQIPVSSKFHWQGKIEDSKEVLLLMESRTDLFDKTEVEISKMHSYDTFVLTSVAIEKISKKAAVWLEKEIKNV